MIVVFSFIFLMVIASWAFGLVYCKKAKANTFQINYIIGIYLLLGGGLVYPFVERKSSILELAISSLATGIPLIIAQWLYIAALTMTKYTGVLNMINFQSIFVSYLISIIRYKEKPNLITNIGIILVFYGVWKTVFNKEQ